MSRNQELIEALNKFTELLRDTLQRDGSGGQSSDDGAADAKHFCSPKALPKRIQFRAAETATKINPVNRPNIGRMFTLAPQADMKLAISVLTTKYWGPSQRQFTVSFLDRTTADFRRRILSHMNAWNQTTNIQFVETTRDGNVRISLGPGGYWSYVGTDILHIPRDRQTMNLEGFSPNTPESEYNRVVRHETGHTLGFPHEHMRKEIVALIDREKAYAYFWRTQRWTREEVDQQVLTPLGDDSIFGTPSDVTSIMCYQLPGEITKNGRPIPGGLDIDQSDFEFAGRIYPKTGQSNRARGGAGDFEVGDDREEEQDEGSFLEAPLAIS
jgi:hypothetical protein